MTQLGRLFMLPVPISQGTVSASLPESSIHVARAQIFSGGKR